VTLRGAISRAVGRTPTAPGADQVRPKVPFKPLIFQLLRPPIASGFEVGISCGRRTARGRQVSSVSSGTECTARCDSPMPRTKAEKKRARARAIGCQRAAALPDRVAELEAELGRARAQVAELSAELSVFRALDARKSHRIAELEACLTTLQRAPTPAPFRGVGGQEQLGSLQVGGAYFAQGVGFQPTPSTTAPRWTGVQQTGDPNTQQHHSSNSIAEAARTERIAQLNEFWARALQ
jgi:hypothetical protein